MYLITEGGDGSGKGEAVRILRRIAPDEFAFSEFILHMNLEDTLN